MRDLTYWPLKMGDFPIAMDPDSWRRVWKHCLRISQCLEDRHPQTPGFHGHQPKNKLKNIILNDPPKKRFCDFISLNFKITGDVIVQPKQQRWITGWFEDTLRRQFFCEALEVK